MKVLFYNAESTTEIVEHYSLYEIHIENKYNRCKKKKKKKKN
jgi:hypothetical protein